jgi:tRNA threonylcarbamoyladenosine biosynthesis protein TsaE
VPTLLARTSSVDETRALARALAELAQPGDLFVLAGDLGAGKTAFVQGFGAGLGVTEPITSPTFTLAQQYQGRLVVHHLDVYRLDQLGEVAELGLSELLDDRGVVLIEWGDAILPVLPNDYLEVRLTFGDGINAGAAADDAGEARATAGAEARSTAGGETGGTGSTGTGAGADTGGTGDTGTEAGGESGERVEAAAGDDVRHISLRSFGPSWGHRQVSLLQAIAPWAETPGAPRGVAPC